MTKLEDDSPMPYSKHKGQPMEDVPVSYLHWLWEEGNVDEKTPVGDYIRRYMDVLKTENTDLIWKRK